MKEEDELELLGIGESVKLRRSGKKSSDNVVSSSKKRRLAKRHMKPLIFSRVETQVNPQEPDKVDRISSVSSNFVHNKGDDKTEETSNHESILKTPVKRPLAENQTLSISPTVESPIFRSQRRIRRLAAEKLKQQQPQQQQQQESQIKITPVKSQLNFNDFSPAVKRSHETSSPIVTADNKHSGFTQFFASQDDDFSSQLGSPPPLVKKQRSLLSPTQLLNIINDSPPSTPSRSVAGGSKRKRIDLNEVVCLEDVDETLLLTNKIVFRGVIDDVTAVVTLEDTSLSLSLYRDHDQLHSTQHHQMRRKFNNPYLIFTREYLAVKELVTDGDKITELSFCLHLHENLSEEFVKTNKSVEILREKNPDKMIDNIQTLQISQNQVVFFYNVGDTGKGTLVTHGPDSLVQAQFLGSVEGRVVKLVNIVDLEPVLLIITETRMLLWSLSSGRCLVKIPVFVNNVVGAVTINDAVFVFHFIEEDSALAFSSLSRCGNEIVKKFSCDTSKFSPESLSLSKYHKGLFVFKDISGASVTVDTDNDEVVCDTK